VEYKTPAGLQTEWERAQRLLEEALALQQQAAVATNEVVRKLVDDLGLSLRDAGKLIGVSHQRIAQLLERSERKIRS